MLEEVHAADPSAAEHSTDADSLSLLTTKLYRPPVTPDLEPRTHLVERLANNRHRPLTLISAPAGYGKTVLVSMWLEASDCPIAWLSLDETDNDLQTFASYLLAALQSAFPALELDTPSLLAAPLLPPPPVLARYLLNDLDHIPEPFILALDDVHVIEDQAVLDFLSELLRHPSPAMHLVVIGRRDPPLPIALLRARRQVTEIRSVDLRFTPPEATRLLGQVLRRDVDDATATEWTRRTEGWVTGLLLAALSLRHGAEKEDIRRDLPEYIPYLQDYLMTEVLTHLPPERREWLLLTSLLDRFCAPLCEVVGQPALADESVGLTGSAFIRWLGKENLFLVPLDDRNEWFRFHHLFQHLLQYQLQEYLAPDQIAAAHRRASHWFAGERLAGEAIQHALAAGDTAAAVQIVIDQRYHLMNAQQWHRLRRLLRQLPADAVAQSAYLSSAQAWLELEHDYDPQGLAAAVQRVTRLLAAQPSESQEFKTVQAELAVLRCELEVLEEGSPPSTADLQEILQVLPPEACHVRATAYALRAANLQMEGEFRQSVEIIREALADPAFPPESHAGLLHLLCLACSWQGDLTTVIHLGHDLLQMTGGSGRPRWVSLARHHLGVAHYLRNELEQAEAVLLALLQDRAVSAWGWAAVGLIALVLLYTARGLWAEARRVLDLAHTLSREQNHKLALAHTEAFRVELALRQGDLAEAQRLSKGVEFEPPILGWFVYVPQFTAIKLMMTEGAPQGLEQARARLECLDEKMARIHRNMVRVQSLPLLALVCDAQGESSVAYDRLTEALLLAEPGGFIRTFVDLGPPMADLLRRWRHESPTERSDRLAGRTDILAYADRILAAFGPSTERTQAAPASPSPPATAPIPAPSFRSGGDEALIEPLTERELDVLMLLAQRLSYKEIGAQLSIAPGTVSQHAVRIYSKLQVHKRREAVAKARDLGIFP